MVSFTGLNTSCKEAEAEELIVWKLCSHSIEVRERSEEQVKEAVWPTVKMLVTLVITRPVFFQE